MPTKHIIDQIEAYLDQQLPPEERRQVEAHVATCATCLGSMVEAHRVASELGPAMTAALGQPLPPAALRYHIRDKLSLSDTARRNSFAWGFSGRVLNAIGTFAVIALLALGAVAVIQGQIPGTNILPLTDSFELGYSGDVTTATTLPTSAATVTQLAPTAIPKPSSSAGDTLLMTTPAPGTASSKEVISLTPKGSSSSEPGPSVVNPAGTPDPLTTPVSPEGTIAFSFFNPAPGRQVYEIHLIEADGTNHRLFPLDGVSEPALRYSEEGHQLAFRAWSEPTAPRSLLSSDLKGNSQAQIGGFFEDAQPDWSPTENRLIFASQRESDRRWRLYTSWGNGLAEKELRREGKSPSFAPDGYRFVFEGCDDAGNQCGLWLANLDDSEYGSQLLLEDPLAQAPDWSPTGEQIVYMANPDGNWDLYLIDRTGNQEPQRLTTDPAVDGLPVWSPDGAWLVFLSNRGGNWGIWLLHVASGELRQIFSFDGGNFNPPARDPYGERNWWDEQLSWSR